MNRAHNSLSMHCQKQYPNDFGQYVDMSTGALGGHKILLDNIDFDTVLLLIGTLHSTCIWLFLSVKSLDDGTCDLRSPCIYCIIPSQTHGSAVNQVQHNWLRPPLGVNISYGNWYFDILKSVLQLV